MECWELGFLSPTNLASCFFHWGKFRDEAHSRLSQLKDKAVKELALYELETKELNRILDHDRQMNEFVGIKLQERSLTEEALKAKEKRGVLGVLVARICSPWGGRMSDSRGT